MTGKFDWSHPAAMDDEALLRECTAGQGRGSGPGGQHRNKVETKVTLTHTPTGIAAAAGERRTARENRREALRRLRLKLATEHRAPVPSGEIGSDLWRVRRTMPKGGQHSAGKRPATPQTVGLPKPRAPGPRGRIAGHPSHRDYPSLLAEAMDVIADAGWELDRASLRLEVSRSQLLKLVKEHPPALGKLNEERAKLGAHPLK